MNLSEIYFLKALDNYPYNLEQAIENLNYSLSYDDGYAPALCLMGKVYMNEIRNYEIAEAYFTKALSADLEYTETYIVYPELLFRLQRIKELMKLLAFAHTVKGVDKVKLYKMEAMINEKQGKLNNAIDCLLAAKEIAFDCDTESNLTSEIKRISKKAKKGDKTKSNPKKAINSWVITSTL